MATSLLNGCALVIDDEIFDTTRSVSKIVSILEAEGTFFIKRSEIPADNTLGNLSGISFIILDWDIRPRTQNPLPEGVQLSRTLIDTNLNHNISFIKDILRAYFIPIFIFSQENTESINTRLRADAEIEPSLDRRVFVKAKGDLTGAKVKTYLNNWLKKNRTFFALKMFEEQLDKSKNSFLVEVGGFDSEWANYVYNTIKLDHPEENESSIQYMLNAEFMELLTNSLLGRINNIEFSEVNFVKRPRNIQKTHIDKIFESIKFYKYGDDIDNGQAFEGDLYQRYENGQPKNEYMININAPCDLRKSNMLFLMGKTKTKYREDGKSFFQLPCFAEKAAIEFRFDDSYRISKPHDLSVLTISENGQSSKTFNRIGRITVPYITAIRNEFAHFISRQGLPRHPKQ